MSEGKIGVFETVSALLLAIAAKALFIRQAAWVASGASWYGIPVAALVAAGIFLLILRLVQRTGACDLPDALKKCGAGVACVGLCALSFTIILVNARLVSDCTAIFPKSVLPTTPADWVIAAMCGAVLLCVMLGLEAVTRTSRFVMPLLVGAVIALLLGCWRWYDTARLFPLAPASSLKTAPETLSGTLLFVDVLALAVLGCPLQGEKYMKRIGFAGLAGGAVLAAAAAICAALVFSQPLLESMQSPLFNMAAMVGIGKYLQRLDEFFVFLWLPGLLVSMAFSITLAMHAFCLASGVQRSKPVAPCFAFLLAVFAALMRSGERWGSMLLVASNVLSGVFLACLGYALLKDAFTKHEVQA